MADRYLIRDLTAPTGYESNSLTMSFTFFCRVKVPENIQKKLAHNEELKKQKTEATTKKMQVCCIPS